ncbi:MAG: lipocalin family protein [Flavobacteriaceae bacterium]|nr:lipocalin family protein [Flavobacteriaceae bacterium]
MNKILLTLFIGIIFSCSKDKDIEIDQVSIIGTWKLIALTSNANEELQDDLGPSDICFWTETYTETTMITTYFSGANCGIESIDSDVSTYVINGTNLLETFDNGQSSVSLEILELTGSTLKLQDSYHEDGENYVDIYTYTKQ